MPSARVFANMLLKTSKTSKGRIDRDIELRKDLSWFVQFVINKLNEIVLFQEVIHLMCGCLCVGHMSMLGQ